MDYQSVIHAFNKVLSKFHPSPDGMDFPEEFAVKRFHKKFERPDSQSSKQRKQQCWLTWIENDESLSSVRFPLPGEWYRARENLHKIFSKQFIPRSVEFSSGSEFTPTRGKNSIEAKLSSSDWTCTPRNFEAFARLCYGHKGLKRAVARRYRSWFARGGFDMSLKVSNLFLFERFRSFYGMSSIGFHIFSWKLSQIVTFVQGSRFSTVPKNNEKDRPIDIQPLANLLVQKSIGQSLRNVLKNHYDCDLDTLADVHRTRISVLSDATIDLKNASDLIALLLCEFLFPKWFYNLILDSRTDFTLGPDDIYYQVNKVSSMGNGFTFELMTLILTSVCRVLDPGSSVFGDDIIISIDKAPRLIEILESVGFQVNKDKSFIDGPFRESCGSNYHSQFGYIESFDFRWAQNISDCVVIANKCARLSLVYPSFKQLSRDLQRCVPKALRGGPNHQLLSCDFHMLVSNDWVAPGRPSLDLSEWFHSDKPGRDVQPENQDILKIIQNLHLENQDVSWFYGFDYIPKLRSNTAIHLKSTAWAKYEMYIASCRRSKDVITGVGRWVPVLMVRIGERVFRYKNLKVHLPT